MIDAKKYYQDLYLKLVLKSDGLFERCDEKDLKHYPLPDAFYKILDVLDKVEKSYGFNMQKNVYP